MAFLSHLWGHRGGAVPSPQDTAPKGSHRTQPQSQPRSAPCIAPAPAPRAEGLRGKNSRGENSSSSPGRTYVSLGSSGRRMKSQYPYVRQGRTGRERGRGWRRRCLKRQEKGILLSTWSSALGNPLPLSASCRSPPSAGGSRRASSRPQTRCPDRGLEPRRQSGTAEEMLFRRGEEIR